MAQKTYGEIVNFVQKKLDLEEELFITTEELLLYCEEAIKFCESEIHKNRIEDMYFESAAPLALVSGVSEYDLPSNIFANKILRIVYNNGSDIYTIPRLKKELRYESGSIIDQYQPSSDYAYRLVNSDVRSGTKLRLYPESRDTVSVVSTTGDTTLNSTTVTVASTTGIQKDYYVTGTGIASGSRVVSVGSGTITLSTPAVATGTTITLTFTEPRVLIHYIRDAAVPAESSDLIDFPEFWTFVAQHMIVECLAKELGNPRIQREEAKLEALRQQVIDTLSEMTPDQDDKIEKDVGSYYDQDLGLSSGEV